MFWSGPFGLHDRELLHARVVFKHESADRHIVLAQHNGKSLQFGEYLPTAFVQYSTGLSDRDRHYYAVQFGDCYVLARSSAS